MSGVIKLGASATTLRDYTTELQGSGISWQRGPAGPFAARVNSSGKYDEIDEWNEWVQENWQAGVGRVDPEGGGFLYAGLETRIPNQLILPPLVQHCDTRDIDNTTLDCRYIPNSVAGTIELGASAKVAMKFTSPTAVGATHFQFYARIPSSVDVLLHVYTDSSGSPSTPVAGAGLAINGSIDNNFHWFGGFLDVDVDGDGIYWFVLEVTAVNETGATAEVAYGTSGYNADGKQWNGSSWTALTGKYLLYSSGLHNFGSETSGAGLFRFNGSLYTYAGEDLFKLNVANNNFATVELIEGAGDVTSHAIFGPTVYFGRSSGNYATMNTSDVSSLASTTRKLFLEYNGLLFGTWQNDLYYTADGSTWSAAFPVGGDDSEIRGMAGMGDSLYLATDKALFRFAPGDRVEEVMRFGAEDSTNGVGMIEYQGRLYIPLAGRLFRYDASGQMMDIWVDREGDLPISRTGTIIAMARMNNWLVAYTEVVSDKPIYTQSSIWVYQDEGWHFLGEVYARNNDLPYAALYYDRGTSRLWWNNDLQTLQYVDIDDFTINPFNLGGTGYLYMPFGWLEQDRFYGGQYLLDKSWESVTIVGDNLSSNVYVKVFWLDEGSVIDDNQVGQWELLGTADSDGEELRWSDYSTRPDGRWIKLALRMQTNDGNETPRIRAIIVKFLPMINDRIQDNVTLTLKSNVQMPDGAPDAYTMAQQLTHIQSLIESVDPIIYQDPFGDQYEVTVKEWNMSVPRYTSTNGVEEMRVTLVLAQLPDAQFA